MQYLGGKSRLCRKFGPLIAAALPGRYLLEPFVGGFNLVPALGPVPALCSDIHPGLVTLYRAVQRGWVPPTELSENRYAELRQRNDPRDPLTAFAAFGCSVGGKEWAGYARNSRGDDYAGFASRSLQRKAPAMRDVTFAALDYRALRPDARHVVYADPPYVGVTGYRTGAFDTEGFYTWCEAAAARGARVFVSEFTVPDRPGWDVVWSIERRTQIDSRTMRGRKSRTEHLLEVRV